MFKIKLFFVKLCQFDRYLARLPAEQLLLAAGAGLGLAEGREGS